MSGGESAAHCFVCGKTSTPDHKIVNVTKLLSAHKSCFCGHQCYTVLNTGKEEQSPARDGKWLYAWRDDVRDYVKPEYADAVFAALAKAEPAEQSNSRIDKEILTEIKAAAREGMAAFGRLAMLV